MYLDIAIIEKINGKSSIIAKNANCVVDLFLKYLPTKAFTRPYVKVNIYLTFRPDENNKIESVTNMIDYYLFFNFEYYQKVAKKFDKKKYILEAVLNAMLKISEIKRWNKDFFFDAYNNCLKGNLINEWWFNKKFFIAPNGKYSIGIYNVYDIDKYEIWLVLFDDAQNELSRLLVFKDEFMSFELEFAAWESSDYFTFKFKGPNKIFRYSSSHILGGIPLELPKRTSDYFKPL
jgi:hypothetical protein